MRATIHLHTARDILTVRPVVQSVLEYAVFGNTTYRSSLEDVDVASVLDAGRNLLEDEPMTQAELRDRFETRWPDRDAEALAYAVRTLLPTVHVPPRGIWGESGSHAMTTVDAWLGEGVEPTADAEEFVRRYLAAFGPATVADARSWSGLRGLRGVFNGLRDELRTFADEDGRELFDLPDAPIPESSHPTTISG